MLVIFKVINVFQKDQNLTFFVIYFYRIKILPSSWDQYINFLIKIHVIIDKKC